MKNLNPNLKSLIKEHTSMSYEFDGQVFLQQSGGPISIRATYAVVRIVINHWDAKWMGMMNDNNIERTGTWTTLGSSPWP